MYISSAGRLPNGNSQTVCCY